MGASVVLVEGHKMGGDCLNYGCVPSKALIAAGKAAHAWTKASVFGVDAQKPSVDYAAAMNHVHQVVADIEPHDSVERFEGLGVTVIQDWARFAGPEESRGWRSAHPCAPVCHRLWINGCRTADPGPRRDAIPDQRDTLVQPRTLPGHLIVIGGGPIGMEMAQAHRRLGSDVTVLEMAQALGGDDPEVTKIALDHIRAEGVDVRERHRRHCRLGHSRKLHCRTGREWRDQRHAPCWSRPGESQTWTGWTWTRPASITTGAVIKVTAGLRSVSNSRVYAIGDVAGGPQFTHVANYHAGSGHSLGVVQASSQDQPRADPPCHLC